MTKLGQNLKKTLIFGTILPRLTSLYTRFSSEQSITKIKLLIFRYLSLRQEIKLLLIDIDTATFWEKSIKVVSSRW